MMSCGCESRVFLKASQGLNEVLFPAFRGIRKTLFISWCASENNLHDFCLMHVMVGVLLCVFFVCVLGVCCVCVCVCVCCVCVCVCVCLCVCLCVCVCVSVCVC